MNSYVYILVPALAWVIAQGLKYLINSLRRGGSFKNTKPLHDSGRMPSAHSATTVSLAIIIGLESSFTAPLFALAALFAGLTMYDALKVRRVVGEQGTFIQRIATQIMLKNAKLPRVAEGHKPLEVLVGAFIGAITALGAYYLAG